MQESVSVHVVAVACTGRGGGGRCPLESTSGEHCSSPEAGTTLAHAPACHLQRARQLLLHPCTGHGTHLLPQSHPHGPDKAAFRRGDTRYEAPSHASSREVGIPEVQLFPLPCLLPACRHHRGHQLLPRRGQACCRSMS